MPRTMRQETFWLLERGLRSWSYKCKINQVISSDLNHSINTSDDILYGEYGDNSRWMDIITQQVHAVLLTDELIE